MYKYHIYKIYKYFFSQQNCIDFVLVLCNSTLVSPKSYICEKQPVFFIVHNTVFILFRKCKLIKN